MRLAPLALAALALAAAAPPTAPPAPAHRDGPPAWAADAIWYQIFPERFRNGDPANDPTAADREGSWPHDYTGPWQVSPWTSDWYALSPWERGNGRGFYYNAQLRRYGGDLQGVVASLDYLQELGVNALYLTPVFQSPSLHKYDARAYHHVDANFGPDPAGDRAAVAAENPADPATWVWTSADRLLLKLIAECHRRGMHVILDGVFNHVGQTFWAFEDVHRRGAASPYAGWFTVQRYDDPATPADEFAYEGWSGVAELPELRKEGDNLAPGPRAHILAVAKRWGDPNGDGDPADGIDGWRLDVADRVGHGFWRDFRRQVLAVNPQAYLTGEVWWQDWSNNRMFDPAPWLQGDQFDAVMNYRFADAVKSFLVDRKKAIGAREFDRRLGALLAGASPGTSLVLMNLLDSHDTDRLASQVVNPDRFYDHANGPKDDPTYEARAPRGDEWKRVRLAAAFAFAWVGAPMVYYGDEAGMWGGDDPDERKPMVWRDLTYLPEAGDPLGRPRTPDPVAFDESLFAYYQRLARLRAGHVALRRGTVRTVVADDARRLFGFVRAQGADRVIAVFNGSEQAQAVDLPVDLPGAHDGLGDLPLAPAPGHLRLELPALTAAVLAGK